MRTHYKVVEDGNTVFIPVSAVKSVHYYDTNKAVLQMNDGSKRFAEFDQYDEMINNDKEHAVEKWAGVNNQMRVEKDGNVYYVSKETGRPAN